MIQFILMYPPFLTSTLASKRTMLINLESVLRAFISSQEIFIPPTFLSHFITEVILASSTPITEKHTKLLDCLSKPSSQLIHHITYPPKEDILAKVVTLCFICVQVHGFASCIPTFCKKISLSLLLLSNHLRSKTLFKHWLVLNSSPLQTMH